MKQCTNLLWAGFIVVGLASWLSAAETTKAPALKPVKVNGEGLVTLKPENSRIDFVGTHEGPKPDPRKGGFAKFAGKAVVSDDGVLKSVAFEFDTASLWTEIPNLTVHLKSPDFFDVRQHPKASFRSTAVRPGKADGSFDVTGEFTLLGKSKELTVPATVSFVASEGLTLVSKFDLDRSAFGMTFGEGKVKKNVTISVAVGAATAARPEK